MVIGHSTLGECLAKGLLHRAVAVVVVRGDGAIILQRRSEKDLWNPGLWTLSCTGHVRMGEPYPSAASRELSEELGLSSPLHEMWKIKIPPIREGLLTENEWVTLFTTTTDAEVSPNPDELAEVREFSPDDIEDFATAGPLTPDARALLGRFLAHPTFLTEPGEWSNPCPP